MIFLCNHTWKTWQKVYMKWPEADSDCCSFFQPGNGNPAWLYLHFRQEEKWENAGYGQNQNQTIDQKLVQKPHAMSSVVVVNTFMSRVVLPFSDFDASTVSCSNLPFFSTIKAFSKLVRKCKRKSYTYSMKWKIRTSYCFWSSNWDLYF